MNLYEKLSKAKAKLLVSQPAFGHIVTHMRFERNDDLQNFVSDGKRFEFNDDFLATCSEEEIEFALCHAALHTVLNHTSRKQKRASYLWQLSTDYAISSMLHQSGFKLPDFARYQKRFSGMYAEEIYEILKDEIKNEEFSDDEEQDTGFNEENKRQNTQNLQKNNKKDDTKSQMEAELEERLEQKFIQELLERFEEEFPEPIKRLIHFEPKASIDWRNTLRRALEPFAKNDYTLFPPSKKLLYEGVYLPSFQSEELHLAIAVDTSASIDETLLKRFLDEVAYILLLFSAYKITFFAADDAIREIKEIQKGEAFPRFLLGGCGTDFRVVFTHIEQKRIYPKLLLYFTDLEGFFPKKAPPYEVIWVTQSEKKAPFGKTIQIPN